MWGGDTFHGLMASLRGRLFRDAGFAAFYCPDNGRDSVPPSLLATALLLQSHDKVSDAEAKARADFDLRWKVALGIEVEDRPFAKSTLQVFRAQLILHDKVREVFESSLRLARESGYLKRRSMKVALDTTNILGRGAVRDTYNLLADGIVKLLRALSQVEGISVGKWAKAQGYGRYLASSIKGEAAIDWSDKRARTALLAGIVADADRLLELSRQAQGELAENGEERQQIVAAAELLGQLLLQDVERTDDGVSLKDGVSRDRMMSAHDPEMRHGRKSSSKRFDGHKAAIVVDTDTQLITAVEVLPGNAPDNSGALELVEQSETNTGTPVEEAMGDAAYGDGDTRQDFAVAGPYADSQGAGPPRPETLSERGLPYRPGGGRLHLSGGERYPENPALGYSHRSNGPDAPTEGLPVRWSGLRGGARCGPSASPRHRAQDGRCSCTRRRRCCSRPGPCSRVRPLASTGSAGWWWSTDWRGWSNWESASPRYFGRATTRFQLYLAATVANLTLVASKAGLPEDTGGASKVGSALRAGTIRSALEIVPARLGQILPLALLASASLPKYISLNKGFPARFLGGTKAEWTPSLAI